jgi:uncharacterized membrane protein YgcG
MRSYTDEDEQTIRVRRLVDEWTRSGLLDAAQRLRLTADLNVDLRRTNRFLRGTLFGFGLLIIAAATGLVVVQVRPRDETTAGLIALAGAGVCTAAVEFLIARFRLYRFGVEEAFAAGAVVLATAGSALAVTDFWPHAAFTNRQLFVGLVTGAAAAFAVYRRFGYVYAAIASMACLALVPFQLNLSEPSRRLLAGAMLGGCFAVARVKRKRSGDEFPGDDYGIIQAAAWLGVYAVLNLHLDFEQAARPDASWFYWLTYAAIWILPAIGLRLSIRDRDRPLLDASLVIAVATVVTNKPYLHLARKPWDPMLFGLLLMGLALVVRRWLAAGSGGSRRGFTATRLLRSDQDALAAAAVASAAFSQPTTDRHADPPVPDPFEGGGGRSGGGGAGASF